MRKTLIACVIPLFLAGAAFAQAPASKPDAKSTGSAAVQPAASSCEAKAIDKNGKPLSGAARTASIKKCEAEGTGATASASCEAKAVGKNGKPLAGAAKTSFMKKCEADASK